MCLEDESGDIEDENPFHDARPRRTCSMRRIGGLVGACDLNGRGIKIKVPAY
jgi:hypothetical protein